MACLDYHAVARLRDRFLLALLLVHFLHVDRIIVGRNVDSWL